MAITTNLSNPATESVTKSYIDTSLYGFIWHSAMPINPSVGDTFFDQLSGTGFTYNGTTWLQICGNGDGSDSPRFTIPTQEQLDKHPALKEAWEEFIVIKKLLGI